MKQEELFQALKNAVRVNRLRESNNPLKPESLTWADAAIGNFHQTGNSQLEAQSLLERADVEFEIAQLKNREPEEFRRHAQNANALMTSALSECASCANDQKISDFGSMESQSL